MRRAWIGILVFGVVAAPVQAVPATAEPPSPDPALPQSVAALRAAAPTYSHPLYLPLRAVSRISCAKSNCTTPDGRVGHGYWAIDFLGERGDPIYAAGYGVAHVGRTGMSCRVGQRAGKGDDRSRGNWVWVDHGAGEETRYFHMNTVRVADGQRVGPATMLGTMGNSGFSSKCPRVNYLHFERRIATGQSVTVDPGPLWACRDTTAVRYPDVLGRSTWNLPKVQFSVWSSGSACLPPVTALAVPAKPVVKRRSVNSAVQVSWPAVAGARQTRVNVEMWHPSTGKWGHQRIVVASAAGPALISGLQRKRTYRFKVAAWGQTANSGWGPTTQVIMADPPAAPPISKVAPSRNRVAVKWRIPDNRGNRITRYRLRVLTPTTGAVVRQVTTKPTVRSVTVTGLRPRTRYRVAVNAQNGSGRGPAATRLVRTTR